jgi:hypothetical protein
VSTAKPPATALFEGARAGGFALPSYTITGDTTGHSAAAFLKAATT